MNSTTGGIELQRGTRAWRDAVELLSSMRFAISLLCLIAIAAVIGTVVKQNEPFINYVNQFGPFWFGIFRSLGLNAVYNSAWFLTILGFLVLSTSLCIVRNAPRMLRDMRAWRDQVREDSLANFGHRARYTSPRPAAELQDALAALLARRGFATRTVARPEAGGTLLVGRAGTWNRLGYILAHSAIVLICLGGLLDSELLLRVQMLAGGKEPVRGDTLVKDVPASGRLSPANPSFRGNVLVPEGGTVRHAILNVGDRALIQELPFTIALKKFIVEYYPTGMPKLFASEVELTDHDSGQIIARTIKVNEPLIHKGIAIYQSSFEDGGSKLRLSAWPMRGAGATPFAIAGEVGGTARLAATGQPGHPGQPAPTIEFTGFRAINVENTARSEGTDGADGKNAADPADPAAQRPLGEHLAEALKGAASATGAGKNRNLHNVGPSVQYKLRDASGQAREFSNYMLPVELEGHKVFLAGVRDSAAEDFRYLRLPADADGSLSEFMRLRAALADPAQRAEAARRYAAAALPASQERDAGLRDKLRASAQRSLDLFAGAGGTDSGAGFVAIARWIERTVPASEQESASRVLMRMLSGSVWELWQVARARAGVAPVAGNTADNDFARLALNALSDSFLYGAPVLLALDGFDQVQASVFQMTRSPGKNIVFLGSIVLVAGIFAMFYIRERRVWIWLKAAQHGEAAGAVEGAVEGAAEGVVEGAAEGLAGHAGAGAILTLAMSTTRPNLDFEREFRELARDAGALASGPTGAAPNT